MAKILRKTAKIFASSASGQVTQFGSLAAATPIYSFDPDIIQGLSRWLGGWYQAVLGDNSPAIEDMNAVLFVLAYQVAYLCQQGVAEYDTATTYYTSSIVSSNGILYVSLIDTNLNQPLSDSSKWRVMPGSGGTTTTVSGSYSASIGEVLVRADATSGGIGITLPAAASTPSGYEITVKKMDATNNQVTVMADVNMDGSLSYILYSQYSASKFKYNGSTWDVI